MIKDLTRGNPAKLIVLFAIPLLIGNLFQQFYHVANAFIVGRTIGVHALAAVGCTASLVFLIIGFVFGFTNGMAIVLAQRFGAGDMNGVRKSFATNLILGGIVAAFMTVMGEMFVRPLLVLMQTPPEILDQAYGYLRIVFLGLGTLVFFNVLSSCLRAVGNSRAPLWYLMIACVVNILLDLLFILGFRMGVEGAAIATVLAQLLAGLLCVPYIWKKGSVFRLTKADWKITGTDLWEHLRIGIPMGFQPLIIATGIIILQFSLNGLGAIPVAAYTAAQRIELFATLPLMSFGMAMATYTAQNLGAKQFRRIRSGVLQCTAISLAFSFLIGLVMIFFGRSLAGLFIASNPEALDLSAKYLTVGGLTYFILGLLFIFRYTLQGLGQNMVPTIAGVMELVMRVIAVLFLIGPLGFYGVCLANPLAWIGSSVPLIIAFAWSLRRKRAAQPLDKTLINVGSIS